MLLIVIVCRVIFGFRERSTRKNKLELRKMKEVNENIM